MLEQVITVKLPEPTLRRLKRAAELTYRTVDEVVTTTLDAALTAPSDLPTDLADELAAMHLLGDEALWAAARPSLSPAEQARLEQLNHLGGERPLTPSEAAEQSALLEAYHRSVLRRAQALAILAQRGHSIPAPIPSESPSNGDGADFPGAA